MTDSPWDITTTRTCDRFQYGPYQIFVMVKLGGTGAGGYVQYRDVLAVGRAKAVDDKVAELKARVLEHYNTRLKEVLNELCVLCT